MRKRLHIRASLALGLLLAACLPAAAQSNTEHMPPSQAAPEGVSPRLLLENGTPINLRALQTVSSASARVGDIVNFEVIFDVLRDGFPVIPRGSSASGTVTEVHNKRRMGRGGKLVIRLDSLQLTDGKKALLLLTQKVRGGNHKTAMAAGMAVTAIAFYPAAPALLFVHGEESVLLKGTELIAYVNGDIPLDPAQVGRKLTVQAPPAAAPALSIPAALVPASASADLSTANQLSLEQIFQVLPRRVLDSQGHEGDMVNLLFVATRGQLEQAFEQAGWIETIRSKKRAVWHAAHKPKNNVAMPMSRLFLFGRPQDYGYAMEDSGSAVTRRHHLRIWKTDYEVNGHPVWAGAATHDIGIEKNQRKWSFTHKIDSEVDLERDFVGERLAHSPLVAATACVLPPAPVLEAKTATGDSYHSNGMILLIRLQEDSHLLARGPKTAH